MPELAALLESIVDLVLPRRCVGCGSVRGVLCPSCWPAGPPLRSGGAVAAAGYDGAVRAALLRYKERGRRDLARPLGTLLAGAVEQVLAWDRGPPPGRVVLVPAPSARSVAAARGGDHVARLARQAAVRAGVGWVADALVLNRSVRDSAGLGVDDRRANLSGAMTAREPRPGWAALVVDDIVTTGATLREAGRALQSAGWPLVGSAVVAATERRTRRLLVTPTGSAQLHGLA